MLLIVFQQGDEHLTVEGIVPLAAVVVEEEILLVGLLLRTEQRHGVVHTHGTGGELVGTTERLAPIHEGTHPLETLVVELLQLVEVEFPLEESRLVLPFAQRLLEVALLLDDTDGIDTFVHADRVFPVVAALGIFRVVLDAHSLIGTHVAEHDFLFHATHLGTRLILGVTHLADAIARQIAVGGARIADGHREVAVFISLHRHRSPVLGAVRHIVLAVGSRTVGLRVGIDAEHREVAGLTGPHPVVGLAAELTHRLGNGEYQSQVGEVAIGGGIELVALVERLDFEAQRRVFGLHPFRHGILQRVEQLGTLVARLVLITQLHHLVGNVVLVDHEAHEHVFVRQLLLVGLGIEAVQHVVVLHGGVAADGLEAAMVVGEYQSVGRYHHTRAVAREVDNGVLDGMVAIVEVVVSHLKTFLLHALIDSWRQVVECPHAFVGTRGQERKKVQQDECDTFGRCFSHR